MEQEKGKSREAWFQMGIEIRCLLILEKEARAGINTGFERKFISSPQPPAIVCKVKMKQIKHALEEAENIWNKVKEPKRKNNSKHKDSMAIATLARTRIRRKK